MEVTEEEEVKKWRKSHILLDHILLPMQCHTQEEGYREIFRFRYTLDNERTACVFLLFRSHFPIK